MGQIDILQAETTDLKARSLDELDVTLDLGALTLDERTDESFDDVIAQAKFRTGNLAPLKKCRHVLRDGGRLRLTNPCPAAAAPGYLDLQEMLLRAAGFTEIELKSAGLPVIIEASKRPPVVEEQEFGMSIREIIDPDEIERTHEYARKYYYNKDYNYDLEVARQFDLHADVYGTYDKTGEMVALARCTLRVPGYDCPFMYAITEDGAHFRVPARLRRAGEIMAIYTEGRTGVVGYKRMMEFLTQYALHIGHADSIWTTNDVNDPYTGNYYKTKFMMEDMGVKLTYRDFGGKWNLLCTDKILELAAIHQGLFRR